MKLKINPVVLDWVRLTIPAWERLQRAGNPVARTDTPDGPRYSVTILRPPVGMVVSYITGTSDIAIRTEEEGPYPRECPASWDVIGCFVPCPARGCGSGLVWYEAGYVPGWRVCHLRGHAAQLTEDGRRAIRHREGDIHVVEQTEVRQ